MKRLARWIGYIIIALFILLVIVIVLWFILHKTYQRHDRPYYFLHPTKQVAAISYPQHLLSLNKKHHVIKVLVLNGGAYGGLVALQTLKYIEQKTHQPIYQSFDYIVGTSTGGIIAVALSMPGKSGHAKYNVQQVIELYKHSHLVQTTFLRRLASLNGMVGPIYSAQRKAQGLHHIVGSLMLHQMLTNVVIASYSLSKMQPVFFASWNKNAYRYQLWQILAGATSPPVFYAPTTIYSLDGQFKQQLTDAGLFANNPSFYAILDAANRYPSKKIEVLSLGAGAQHIALNHSQLVNWGYLAWAPKMFRLINYAINQYTDYTLNFYAQQHWNHISYHFFNINLPAGVGLFNGSQKNIEALQKMGKKMVAEHKKALDDICEHIKRDN